MSSLSTEKRQWLSLIIFTLTLIDDVFFIDNSDFKNYLGHDQMCPIELKIKDTKKSNKSASYLDFIILIGRDSQQRIFCYDKK